jgi:hypothetical protein
MIFTVVWPRLTKKIRKNERKNTALLALYMKVPFYLILFYCYVITAYRLCRVLLAMTINFWVQIKEGNLFICLLAIISYGGQRCVDSVTSAVHQRRRLNIVIKRICRSWWPRLLRLECAAARLLGLRVRIPPRTWMSVPFWCCVLWGRLLCDGPISRP